MLPQSICRKKRRRDKPPSALVVYRRSCQGAGSSEATSHQTAAPRARADRLDRKIFECAEAARPHTCPPTRPVRRAIRLDGKSALGSGGCSYSCPTTAVDTTGAHDKLEKRKRCTNSMSSASLPLFTKRGGTRAEFIAEFPQSTCVGASADGAAGRSTRSRGRLAPTWTVLACSNRPDSVQQPYPRAAKRAPTPRRESGPKRQGNIVRHFPRGLAWALQ